jgi:hypothetical protein
VGLFSSEKKTPAEWREHLARENTPITLEEYMVGILARMYACVLNETEAMQHVEGMVGAIDESFARHDPEYAGSSTVRAALDVKRHDDRAAALRDMAGEAAARRSLGVSPTGAGSTDGGVSPRAIRSGDAG